MGNFVADELIKILIKKGNVINNLKILVLGITFKENCPDIRNTGVMNVINRLKEFGLDITIFDPWANPSDVEREYGIKSLNILPKEKYESILIAVAHNEFRTIDFESLKKSSNSIVYDLKGFTDVYTNKL